MMQHGNVNTIHTMPFIWQVCSILATVYISWQTYLGHVASRDSIGSWGCEMSWMTPSYSLVPTAPSRYRLYLYREQGWDGQPRGRPVLFIPGNAGSYQQVRSIASLAARTRPGMLDFYTGKSHVDTADDSRPERRILSLLRTHAGHPGRLCSRRAPTAVCGSPDTGHNHRSFDGRHRGTTRRRSHNGGTHNHNVNPACHTAFAARLRDGASLCSRPSKRGSIHIYMWRRVRYGHHLRLVRRGGDPILDRHPRRLDWRRSSGHGLVSSDPRPCCPDPFARRPVAISHHDT